MTKKKKYNKEEPQMKTMALIDSFFKEFKSGEKTLNGVRTK